MKSLLARGASGAERRAIGVVGASTNGDGGGEAGGIETETMSAGVITEEGDSDDNDEGFARGNSFSTKRVSRERIILRVSGSKSRYAVVSPS